MIATASPRTLPPPALEIPRRVHEFAHLSERLRSEAVDELRVAVGDTSGKRLTRAAVPGCTRHGVSRALNGCDSNPLFRVAALFLMMKRLGLGRERAQRMVDWLQSVVDAVWPEGEGGPALEEAIERETELDLAEDLPQMRVALGDRGALGEWLDALRARAAYDRVVIAVVRRELAARG